MDTRQHRIDVTRGASTGMKERSRAARHVECSALRNAPDRVGHPRRRAEPVVYHFPMPEVPQHSPGCPPGSVGDPLAALRAATASRHAWVDRSMPLGTATSDADALDARALDPDAYRLHLLLIRQWLAPIEAWLASFDDGPQDRAGPAAPAQLAALDDDLAALGCPPPAGAAVARPAASRRSTSDPDDAFRWGVCYVLEGSRLGGLVLHQRVAGRLAPHRPTYLCGDREAVGRRWRIFMQKLRAAVTGRAQIERACAGACAAFDDLIDVVTSALPATAAGVPER